MVSKFLNYFAFFDVTQAINAESLLRRKWARGLKKRKRVIGPKKIDVIGAKVTAMKAG
jgi:hypothetical protein